MPSLHRVTELKFSSTTYFECSTENTNIFSLRVEHIFEIDIKKLGKTADIAPKVVNLEDVTFK